MTCTGACCAAFPLSVPLATLQDDPDRFTDGPYLAAMVVGLDPVDVVWRRVLFGLEAAAAPVDQPGPANGGGREYFTCTHWDEGTRRCAAYDDRPHTCRSYPNHQACAHCGQAAT